MIKTPPLPEDTNQLKAILIKQQNRLQQLQTDTLLFV